MSVKQDLIIAEQQSAELRRTMGAKKYDEWVRSQQIIKYTNFESWDEAKKFVNKAGYDFINMYGYLKTHIGSGKDDYFFWSIEKGRICAVFYVFDDKTLVNNFISKVESAYGKTCFYDLSEEMKVQIFPTNFTNKIFLLEALKRAGLKPEDRNGEISCKQNIYTIIFNKENKEHYELKVIGHVDLKTVHNTYNKVNSLYQGFVQKRICENIKNKVSSSSSMSIAKEEVLEDNSVLLTINI